MLIDEKNYMDSVIYFTRYINRKVDKRSLDWILMN